MGYSQTQLERGKLFSGGYLTLRQRVHARFIGVTKADMFTNKKQKHDQCKDALNAVSRSTQRLFFKTKNMVQ